MSLKKVEQVKRDRGFKIADLIIYGVIIALVAVLFIVIFATRNTDELHGITIKVRNEAVFECNFDDVAYGKLVEDDSVIYDEPQDGKLIVTVKSGGGYNIVEIDLTARIVRVTEADCRSHDCLYTSLNPVQIKDNNSVIFCSPHAMLIEPLNYKPDLNGPVII